MVASAQLVMDGRTLIEADVMPEESALMKVCVLQKGALRGVPAAIVVYWKGLTEDVQADPGAATVVFEVTCDHEARYGE